MGCLMTTQSEPVGRFPPAKDRRASGAHNPAPAALSFAELGHCECCRILQNDVAECKRCHGWFCPPCLIHHECEPDTAGERLGSTGFEPVASCVSSRRSNQLS